MGLVKHIQEIQRPANFKPEEKKQIFGATGLLNTEPVQICMKENTEPYCLTTARRVPFPLEQKVKEELEKMEKADIIEKVTEPTDWCAPMVPVLKPNKKVRICVDFKKLNEAIKRPHCMLPNLDDIAPRMAGSSVFSTLDASSGFFQIPLEESSKKLTTFITPFGRYCFQRLPMGISLGPEVNQTKMKETLEGLPGCEVIMDYTIIFGTDIEDHDKKLAAVLDKIEKSGLKLNKVKCCFRQKEVKYFGHLIGEKGIKPNPEKVEAIIKLEAPTSMTELRSVCGMFNYMGKFVPQLATIMKPLTDLMKKSSHWSWGKQQQEAFNLIKEKISTATALAFYNPRKEIVVSADSSSYGLGAVLMQKVDDQLQPIAFASRILTDTEKGYAQIEKETLASVYACEKFENYLIGLDSFELQTDHKPLVPLIKTNDLDKTPARCQRLLMRRMRFNPVAVHVPEKDLVIADALSRHPQNHTIDEMELEENVQAYVDAIVESWPTSTPRLQTLRHETARDPELQKVSHYVMTGWPSKIPEDLQHYQQYQCSISSKWTFGF
ncbi:hypothetical protein RRG08_006331 [Elysia crispata]|uniref:Reverse transcriptase domain-containing protein n=1 Tax=Elysia crispata TaxID=231223 RepID=A0AAE0YQC4_9GAST|nr:hypothetical protein RRG08_006331 [Elysia crispata]